MKNCDLSVGDWIIIEHSDAYAYVLSVHDIYYEAFHTEVQEGSCRQGDYNNSLVIYRIYCTLKGKRINRKPAYSYYGVEKLRKLNTEEKDFIDRILESDPDGFNNWKNESVFPTEYEHIDIPVVSATPKSVMNKFKKAVKQLSSPFTFIDLRKICKDIKSMDWNHINEVSDNYISFDMFFTIGNHSGNCILFDQIKHVNYTDGEEDKKMIESFFSFETVFLSLARFVKEYDCLYPSESNAILLARLKEIWNGLFHQNWKEQPLAYDFFTHAPKEMYSFKLAYSTALGFLERNVDELDCQRLVDFLLEEEKGANLYKRVYNALKGML